MLTKRIKTFVNKYLLAPPKCLFCGGEKCSIDMPVCTNCYPHYTRFMLEGCADCGAMPLDCSCFSIPNCVQHYRLFNYGDPMIRHMIYRLKGKHNKHGSRFLAGRLLDMVLLKTAGKVSFDCITFVPRNRKGRLRYGFDHAEKLAKQVAKLLGVPCKKLLVNTDKVGEQKRFKRSFRGMAAKLRFGINTKALENGRLHLKNVIIVDDVVTTGSSMGECAKLLKAHGVKQVFGLFIAHTPSRR